MVITQEITEPNDINIHLTLRPMSEERTKARVNEIKQGESFFLVKFLQLLGVYTIYLIKICYGRIKQKRFFLIF
jgi:hypothetical protein